MAYTKPAQTAFTNKLRPDDFVVKLDTGQLVAVGATITVESNTGNTTIVGTAYQANADGSPFIDGAGYDVTAGYAHSADAANLALAGGVNGLQRLMLLTLLGEPAAWPHALDATVLEHASIRSNIAAAAFAGPVKNLSALL